jgi:hypothetical protein
MKIQIPDSFFKRSSPLTGPDGKPMIPGQNAQLTNPAGAASQVGSMVANGISVTFNGQTLSFDGQNGFVTLMLTPQQIDQMKSEFGDLV